MVLVIIGLVAFLVGGYVTGRTLGEDRDAPAEGARDAGLHGILTWALATVVILVLSGPGVATLFGPVGDMMGPLDPEQISQAARDGALGTFFSLLL